MGECAAAAARTAGAHSKHFGGLLDLQQYDPIIVTTLHLLQL